MIKVKDIAARALAKSNAYGFAGLPFGKKRDKVKPDLPKYDVVIAGGHLGALLSNHLDGAVGSKASIFVAYDKPNIQYHAIRTFYEKGDFSKFQMQTSPKNSMSKFAAPSEGNGVSQFKPKENAVVLKNGRRVEYDHLVIATGLRDDYESIKGFEEAWSDLDHPFYTNADHSTWRSSAVKSYRYIYNFQGGQAYFYIPPTPFHGEIDNYNFFVAKDIWDRYNFDGRLSWNNSRYTIINANNSFCQRYEEADNFIKEELQKRNINVEYGLKLIEINKQKNLAIFENSQTGEKVEKPYQSFYSLMPAKPDTLISNSGLAASNGLLDVDPYTLQHKKYDNIFGFGDVANLPTSKNFYAGFNQLSVVRHNVERRINGHTPDAHYDGYAESLLQTGISSSTKVSHLYDGKGSGSLDTGFMAAMKYMLHNRGKKAVIDILKFKNWGPPFYKFKKTFKGGIGAPVTPFPPSAAPTEKSQS